MDPIQSYLPKPLPQTRNTESLEDTAKAFEAIFVARMLDAAGFGKARGLMGGGAGEDVFSSFLVHSYAERFVENGGFGLSEAIVRSLAEKQTT